MNRVVLFASIVAFAPACGSEPGASASPTSAPPAPSGETAIPDVAPSGLRIVVERLWTGEIAISVEEHEDERVSLQRAMIVEQQVGERWNRVEASGLTLRADCSTEAPACVELSRGGALRPPPWSTRSGKGQCTTATEGTPVPAGRYRVVVTTCGGGHRVESAPFNVQR